MIPFEIPIMPEVRRRERERQDRIYSLRVDEFVRWAYSDKGRRKGPFDAYFFQGTTVTKEQTEGIAQQAIANGYFKFHGRPDLVLQDDHVEEAMRRRPRYLLVRQLRANDDVYPICLTPAGQDYAKEMWWKDRPWFEYSRRVGHQVFSFQAFKYVIAAAVGGVFAETIKPLLMAFVLAGWQQHVLPHLPAPPSANPSSQRIAGP
jgi:hypothetical protein